MPVLRWDILIGVNTTERERILHALLVAIAFNAGKYNNPDPKYAFSYVDMSTPPKPGDWVVGACGQVGQLVDFTPEKEGERSFSDSWGVRIAGIDRIENWQNETFYAFRGLHEWELLPGEQWEFYRFARVEICKDDRECRQRFAGIEFRGEDAVISFRERWCDDVREVTVPNYRRYLKHKTPRHFKKLLTDAGWGKDDFIRREKIDSAT